MNTRPNLTRLVEKSCPASVTELEDTIRASQCIDIRRSFENLAIAIQQTKSFVESTLAFLWQEAMRSAATLPDIPVLDRPGTVTLTQRECLCILANAFFCTFSDRVSNNCDRGPDMPSINLDELYGGQSWGRGGVEVAKLRMLFNYFEQCQRRLISGNPLLRPVHTIRCRAEKATEIHWRGCRGQLVTPVVHPLEQSLDAAKGMLQVDFANRLVGGGALAYGCVQEEIMFCVCPELIVSRLFCPAMNPGEAIIFIGAEQFSDAKGYASRLEYGGGDVDDIRRTARWCAWHLHFGNRCDGPSVCRSTSAIRSRRGCPRTGQSVGRYWCAKYSRRWT